MASEYQLLTDLGFDPRDVSKAGAWFRVSERAIINRSDGSPFARDKAAQGGKRPVVLASPWGLSPNAVFFPRTTSGSDGYAHNKHDHRSVYPECRINRAGRVVNNLPVTVKARELSLPNWSCAEPESSGLYAEMERWLQP